MAQNKFLLHRAKKKSKKQRAAQGMTAAIILIAFIITAAGIAFVILTMGSNFQQKLETIGTSGSEAASSALRVEGGFVVGYCMENDDKISGYFFTLKMVLETGEVDFADDQSEFTIIVANNTEETLINYNDLDSVAEFNGTDSNAYGLEFYDAETTPDELLEPGEMVMVFINTICDGASGIGADANDKVVIIIVSGVAMIKIEKTMPTGIEEGANILK